MNCKSRLTLALLVAQLSSGMAVAQSENPDSNTQDFVSAASNAVTSDSLAARHDGIGQTLEDFFLASLDYSPRLKIAEERMNIGEAQREAANGRLMPQVSANSSISGNRQQRAFGTDEYHGERMSLQVQQILFDWGTFKRRSQAYLQENQFEAEYYAELAALLADVSILYLDVLQAQDALNSSQSELEAVSTQLQQIERMHEMQLVQITDLYEAQARKSAVQAEQVLLQSELTLAQESLRAASGLALGDLYTLGDEAELPPIDGTLEEWIQRARENNQVIQSRRLAVNIANDQISEQRGNYMPQVSLVMQQQRSDLGFDNAAINRTDTGYVGLNVSMPLFAGGSNRAAVKEAVSRHSIAQHELRQTNLDIEDQTRNAYLRLQAAERQVVAAESLLESRQISTRARRRGFELGTVTSVDVLDAVRDEFIAERDLQQVRYDYLRLSLQLQRDAGTLDAEDLIDISQRLEAPDDNR
jgi:outer membrane protein